MTIVKFLKYYAAQVQCRSIDPANLLGFYVISRSMENYGKYFCK